MGLAQSFREFRPRLGTAHGTESLLDPGPIFARVRYHLGGSSKAPGATGTGQNRSWIPA